MAISVRRHLRITFKCASYQWNSFQFEFVLFFVSKTISNDRGKTSVCVCRSVVPTRKNRLMRKCPPLSLSSFVFSPIGFDNAFPNSTDDLFFGASCNLLGLLSRCIMSRTRGNLTKSRKRQNKSGQFLSISLSLSLAKEKFILFFSFYLCSYYYHFY